MTIIEKYKLAIFVLVLIISALLIANGILVLKLRGKNLDGKIARGRRTQRRMEQHPKRYGGQK